MGRGSVASVASLALAVTLVFLSSAPAVGQAPSSANQTWNAPRTVWGDPDLQGLWTNTTTTPFERPNELAGKQILSDQEQLELDQQTAARLSFDNKPRPGSPGGYNEFWVERGRLSKQTSLVVDPADGKVPALTPEAQKRVDARAQYRRDHPADSFEDVGLFTRCLTRGLPNAMTPGFYNHNYQIFQAPGYVAILIEMIHEVRVIPVDGRPHTSSNVQQWMGDSRGDRKSTRLNSSHIQKSRMPSSA